MDNGGTMDPLVRGRRALCQPAAMSRVASIGCPWVKPNRSHDVPSANKLAIGIKTQSARWTKGATTRPWSPRRWTCLNRRKWSSADYLIKSKNPPEPAQLRARLSRVLVILTVRRLYRTVWTLTMELDSRILSKPIRAAGLMIVVMLVVFLLGLGIKLFGGMNLICIGMKVSATVIVTLRSPKMSYVQP